MPISQLIKHPHVLAGIGAAAVIAACSAGFYMLSTGPSASSVSAAQTAGVGDITAQGVVSAVQNPELAFAIAGRVTGVYAKVGQRVSAGQVLATTDTGTLSASLAGAQARLNELTDGPVSTDLESANTGVAQAQAALDSLYDAIPGSVSDARAKAASAIYVTIAPLVGNQGTQGQMFTFNSRDNQSDIRVGQEYDKIQLILDAWDKDSTNLDAASSAQKEAALADTLAKLRQIRAFLTDLSALLSNASDSTFGEGMTAQSARSAVLAASASVNTLITSLTSQQSSLASAKLGVTSAQTALKETTNGARSEEIAAQRAVVSSAAAALRQAEIIAPFSGTVGSVAVKLGDVVVADTQGVSLLPDGASQVDIYVSEIDVARISVGEPADITLDAYGADRVFAGTISAIDAAPSPSGEGGAQGYKVTIVLNQKDPAVTIGMHANVTIHVAAAH
jgi:HlyD family secretion protein